MKKEIIIALVTISTILVSVWGYRYLLGSNLLERNFNFYTIFNEVKDIEIATEVLVNGLKVGTVTDINLMPDNVNKIRVDFEVDKDIRIPNYTKAVIKSDGLMGGRFIDLEFDKMCSGNGDCAEDGDLIEGQVVGLLGSMVSISEFDKYTASLGNSVSGMMGDSSSTVDPSQTFANLDKAISNLENITLELSTLLQRSNASLQQSFSNLSAITGNIASNDDKINAIIQNLETTSQKIASLNLDQTLGGVNGAVSSAETTITELSSTIAEAKSSISSLQNVIDGVNDQKGSLGMLIHDNSLYENLDNTSNQLNLLLQDLRLNPKRYVNVSVFGKKQKEYTVPDDDPASGN